MEFSAAFSGSNNVLKCESPGGDSTVHIRGMLAEISEPNVTSICFTCTKCGTAYAVYGQYGMTDPGLTADYLKKRIAPSMSRRPTVLGKY